MFSISNVSPVAMMAAQERHEKVNNPFAGREVINADFMWCWPRNDVTQGSLRDRRNS